MSLMHSKNNQHVTGNFDFEENDGYEYSQPITYTFSNSTGVIKDLSPFGVDSEVGLLYYSSSDSAGVVLLQFDLDVQSQSLTAPPAKTIGMVLRGTVPGTSFTPIFSPVKNYTSIGYAIATNAIAVITLLYRRESVVTVPQDETFYANTVD